jgi:hypothetical protein
LLWPIVILSMAVSIIRVYRQKPLGLEYSTSGLQLVWIKLQCYNSKIDQFFLYPLVKMIRGGFKNGLLFYHSHREDLCDLIQTRVRF